MNKFVYLGATVSQQGGGMVDMRGRVSKARPAFTKFKKIWISNKISKKTKTRLFKILVTPVLMYGCETWKMNNGVEKRINVFHNNSLRRTQDAMAGPNNDTRNTTAIEHETDH